MNKGREGIEMSGRQRVAIYGRYSSIMQRASSAEDQARVCREAAERKGWEVLDDFVYKDEARTGRTTVGRAEFLRLMEVARTRPRPFDGVIIYDPSRLGRHVTQTLAIAEELSELGIFLYFAQQGLDSRDPTFRMMQAIQAICDEHYIQALSDRVRRGQEGRVRAGFNPSGRLYGLQNVEVKDPDRAGLPGRAGSLGVRQVPDPEKAAVVLRVFKMYAEGCGQIRIAKTLNADGIRSPNGKGWTPRQIGNMLKNERYRGVRVWNRRKNIFSAKRGTSKQIPRPEAEHIRVEVPELRIVPEDLWQAVQRWRQQAAKLGPRRLGGYHRARRPHLFTGILKCGVCGGAVMVVSVKKGKARFGCRAHRDANRCPNWHTILEQDLDEQLFAALGAQFADPEVLGDTLAELERAVKKMAEAGHEACSRRPHIERELAATNRRVQNLVEAVAQHRISAALSEELERAELRRDELKASLAAASTPAPTFTTDELREFLQRQMGRFAEILAEDRALAREELRKRIDKIILTPRDTPEGPALVASGDLRLFATGDDGALQRSSFHRFSQQYTQLAVPLRPIILIPSRGKRTAAPAAGAISSHRPPVDFCESQHDLAPGAPSAAA